MGGAGLASVKWEHGLSNARTADCKMDPPHDTIELISWACGAFVMIHLRKAGEGGGNTEEGGGAAGTGAETLLQPMKDPCWSRYCSVATWGSHSGAGGWISLKEAIDHEETPHRNRGKVWWGRRNARIPICQNPRPNLLWRKLRSLGWSWAWEERMEENCWCKVCLFFFPRSILMRSK